MPRSSTVLARFPIFALRCAAELGLDPDEVTREAGFGEDELRDPDARIKLSRAMGIWRRVLDANPDPDLGVRIGAQLRVRDAGLVGFLMAHSPTLGQALDRLTCFSRILDSAYPLPLEIDRDIATYSTEPMPEERLGLWKLADLNAASVVAVVREITGQKVVPIEIGLPYRDRPSNLGGHRSYFGCPLRFDAARSQIVFARRHLDLAIVGADEEIGRYLENHAAEVLRGLAPEGTVADRLERALWSGMKDGDLSLESAAPTLALGTRTLQRRLREEGTSFAAVRDGLRRQMAIQLLENRELAVYEIALLLGYSEPSTFHRAFRRCTGSSPHQYRAERLG